MEAKDQTKVPFSLVLDLLRHSYFHNFMPTTYDEGKEWDYKWEYNYFYQYINADLQSVHPLPQKKQSPCVYSATHVLWWPVHSPLITILPRKETGRGGGSGHITANGLSGCSLQQTALGNCECLCVFVCANVFFPRKNW